jgi:hypothetical protein
VNVNRVVVQSTMMEVYLQTPYYGVCTQRLVVGLVVLMRLVACGGYRSSAGFAG